MTYDFFADHDDKLLVLKYIFQETDLKVFDTASPYGMKISEYKSVEEIASKFDLTHGQKFEVTFQLWSPRHKGEVLFRKVDLDPKYCNGHTFRYSTNGWGLIQLYLGGLKNNRLYSSHIGHFNEKGALKNEEAIQFNGNVKDWDWNEVQITSRKLKHYIDKKLSVRRMGSFGILPGADKMEKQGISLR